MEPDSLSHYLTLELIPRSWVPQCRQHRACPYKLSHAGFAEPSWPWLLAGSVLTIASCFDVAAGKLPPAQEYELGMVNAREPMTAPGAEIA